MQETKDAHDDEENMCRDDMMKPLVKFEMVQQVDEEAIMDPATTNPGDSLGVASIEEPAMKTDCIKSEGGSGTGSQFSEPSIKGQETEPDEGLDHNCDVTTSQVSEVAEESERGFSGFDLNEFYSEERPECSLSGTHSNSKQRSVCLDIDLNVADDNEDKDVIISGLPSGEESSVNASPWRPMMLHLDLNMCQSQSQSCSSSSSSSSKESSMKNFDLKLNLNNDASLDHQKAVISLFGTQIEVNQRDISPHPNSRIFEPPASMASWGHGGFAAGPSMYYYSPCRPLGAPTAVMADPRGVPIAPQFAPPFVMSMADGPNFGPTGAEPLQQNMGLNLGLVINVGNSGGSSGSVVGGKRQEPDGGWEGFPVNYKHQHPSWK